MTDTRDLERGNTSLGGAVKGSRKAATPSRAQERETEDSRSHCRSPSRWRHCTFLSLAPWRATTSATTLNLSHFVARKIGQRRGVFPLHGRAQRLQRREPLRCLLVPIATIFDLLQTAIN